MTLVSSALQRTCSSDQASLSRSTVEADLAQFKTSFSALLGIADWFYHSGYSIKGEP